MDFTLELVVVPDVDRAKAFYSEQCGFTVDVDHSVSDEFRVVQVADEAAASAGDGTDKRP